MVQWLGLGAFTARAQVQSLIGELKSYKLRGTAEKKMLPSSNGEQVVRDVHRPQLSAHLAEPRPLMSMHLCLGTCLGKMGVVGHHTTPLAERLEASNPFIMRVV